MTVATGTRRARGHTAVMANRREPPDALDFFPTPPWATRALHHHVINRHLRHGARVWEPAAGAGHMAEVIHEWTPHVRASDVFDYGRGYEVGSFVGQGLDVLQPEGRVDWVITNPPFNLALEFALKAVPIAVEGVAMLVRTAWLEGGTRYRDLFSVKRPDLIAQFAERVPMVKGRWDPEASTATAYCWVVWMPSRVVPTEYMWIPPGQRERLTRAEDVQRFARERA